MSHLLKAAFAMLERYRSRKRSPMKMFAHTYTQHVQYWFVAACIGLIGTYMHASVEHWESVPPSALWLSAISRKNVFAGGISANNLSGELIQSKPWHMIAACATLSPISSPQKALLTRPWCPCYLLSFIHLLSPVTSVGHMHGQYKSTGVRAHLHGARAGAHAALPPTSVSCGLSFSENRMTTCQSVSKLYGSNPLNIHTYMQTYIHTYKYVCIHTCTHVMYTNSRLGAPKIKTSVYSSLYR